MSSGSLAFFCASVSFQKPSVNLCHLTSTSNKFQVLVERQGWQHTKADGIVHKPRRHWEMSNHVNSAWAWPLNWGYLVSESNSGVSFL